MAGDGGSKAEGGAGSPGLAQKRKQGCALWVIIIVVGLVVIDLTNGDDSKSPEASALAKIEDPAPAPGDRLQAGADWYRSLITQGGACEARFSALTKELQKFGGRGGDRQRAYDVAQGAVNECRSARETGWFDPPTWFSAAGQAAGKAARDQCRAAVSQRKIAAQVAARAIDGDAKPSTVSEFRAEVGEAERATMGCIIGAGQVAQAEGFDVTEFLKRTVPAKN